ncbi:MAG: dTDP-4-amino-4,6-dideoxygalactose transaminase [Pseudomonadales bacterium]
MIPFNKPAYTGLEDAHVIAAMRSPKISGDGPYTMRCQQIMSELVGAPKTLLTPSCTHALEMSALLIDLQPGDEVIMPSYTFASTANAFVLRGARIVFVDIRPDTMNIDESLIAAAITGRTRAIVPVHYAGVACEMDTIINVASHHGLYVIEDAAQGMMAQYKGRQLGSIGDIGAYSFHETKNYTSGGEGGLLILNRENFVSRAEIIREKGTNRSEFFRGETNKYCWKDIGSSYLPSELQAAYLFGQLECVSDINTKRIESWESYYSKLSDLEGAGVLSLPYVPEQCVKNGHMFYIKTKNEEERFSLIQHLDAAGIHSVPHYVPLHSSPAGLKYGRFHGKDIYTTSHSDRLLRLPLWYGMDSTVVEFICSEIISYYGKV